MSFPIGVSSNERCVFYLCLRLSHYFKTESKTMTNATFLGKCYVFQWQ